MTITEPQIRALLDEIVDPCSEAAGCAAGLDAMGMLPTVEVTQTDRGANVKVVVAVTEFGCLMGAPFMAAIEEKLRDRPGIAQLDIRLDDRFDWTPERMRPDYRDRLEATRALRRAYIPISPFPVMPAEAGIQSRVRQLAQPLDPRLRGDDGVGA